MNKSAKTFSRFSLLLALICLLGNTADAQSNRKLIRNGNKFFDKENYRAAAPFYEQVLAKDPDNARALYFAGISYMTFDKEKAVDYIYRAQTLRPNLDREMEYWLGRVNHINYRFDEAIQHYQNYIPRIQKRDQVRRQEVARLIQHSKNAKHEVANQKDVFVRNLGSVVNTSYSEHSPVISSDDNYLLFTSRSAAASGGKSAADGEYYEDIFESRRNEEGEWSQPQSLAGALSSSGHDASIQLYDNDTKMLLYRQQNNGDIMVSERSADGRWGTPQSIGATINTRGFESDAYITPDGNTLYFSTSNYSQEGDLDIYVAQRQRNGQWGKPRSIGNTINSKFDDDSPYLASDGTLYFSSRGHNTMGGYDIFSSKYDSVARRWSKPVNLGAPVNTPDDDTYYRLSPDGSYAFLSSYRIGGVGEKDIYTINYIRNLRVQGQVFAASDSTTAIPGVELVFNSTQADRRAISYRDITKPDSGNYQVSVLSGRTYQIEVLKDGKSISTETFEMPVVLNDTTALVKNFYVPISVDVDPGRFAMKNIYYDTDKYNLRSESIRELDNIAEVMKANPGMNLSIDGHTDSRASDSYNMTLGDNRAKAAYDYLVEKGISARRMVTVSYGERRPAVPNTSAENMQLNRRTEFRVIPRQQENTNPDM
ncbi:OmpA family protein [Pontibacter qinzhouensis]|uniref:OmpA family protein n=1 Tax=Pontibacter qinzhouensis TaxID=2603253 RepID=A0A5C8K710_9BACT|nr:OmpA family protein [Pontibacter qinzhouensis]TXK48044.1 OmpA family protein [Pontibacter qinzhouensis]